MSEPLTTDCAYCGSPDVLDDAWFCDKAECWAAYWQDARREYRMRQWAGTGVLPWGMPARRAYWPRRFPFGFAGEYVE